MRSEDYYEWDNINKRQIRKSRIVTDWLPYSQQVAGKTFEVLYSGFDDYKYLASFIEDMGWEAHDLISLAPEDAAFPKIKDKFKYTLDDAWKQGGLEKSQKAVHKQTIDQLPSKLVRNLNINIEFNENGTFALIVPYWVFTYDYEGKSYFVAVDGNNSKRVHGIKPKDTKRRKTIVMYRLLGWICGLFLTFFGVYLNLSGEMKNFKMNIALTSIIVVGLITTYLSVEYVVKRIKKDSKLLRAQKLAQKSAP